VIKSIIEIPKRLYRWTEKLADSKHGERSLYLLSASEAIFFPIPPDPLLMSMIFHKHDRWLRYTTLTIFFSVLGGVVGYFVGWALFESIGNWLLDTLHIRSGFEDLSTKFSENAALAVFSAALTPIPYKIVTLTAGFSGVNFGIFIVASIIGRGARFLAVGALAHYLGKKHKDKIEEYINVVSLALIGLIVLALLLVR